jgi:hypothetical protein
MFYFLALFVCIMTHPFSYISQNIKLNIGRNNNLFVEILTAKVLENKRSFMLLNEGT